MQAAVEEPLTNTESLLYVSFNLALPGLLLHCTAPLEPVLLYQPPLLAGAVTFVSAVLLQQTPSASFQYLFNIFRFFFYTANQIKESLKLPIKQTAVADQGLQYRDEMFTLPDELLHLKYFTCISNQQHVPSREHHMTDFNFKML